MAWLGARGFVPATAKMTLWTKEQKNICAWSQWPGSQCGWGGLKVVLAWGHGGRRTHQPVVSPEVLAHVPPSGCTGNSFPFASGCVCVRDSVCVGGGMGGGGEWKDNIQLNNLVVINPYLPGFFSPAGQRSSLRDGQGKIPFLCAGKHTDLFGWKFLVSPQSHFLSSCSRPGFTLFMNFHILDSPEKACTPNSPSWRRESTF